MKKIVLTVILLYLFYADAFSFHSNNVIGVLELGASYLEVDRSVAGQIVIPNDSSSYVGNFAVKLGIGYKYKGLRLIGYLFSMGSNIVADETNKPLLTSSETDLSIVLSPNLMHKSRLGIWGIIGIQHRNLKITNNLNSPKSFTDNEKAWLSGIETSIILQSGNQNDNSADLSGDISLLLSGVIIGMHNKNIQLSSIFIFRWPEGYWGIGIKYLIQKHDYRRLDITIGLYQ